MSDMHESAPQSAARWRGWLRRRVAWLTDARRDLDGRPSEARMLVVVLGREHYQERRRRYPLTAWRDLERVLAEEAGSSSTVIDVIGPVEADTREVTSYELRPGSIERVGRALFVVPESLLLARTLDANSVATVERDGLAYFVDAKGMSQPVGGTLLSAELFALATGTVPTQTLRLSRDSLPARLLQSLPGLEPGVWQRCIRPGSAVRSQLDWRKIALWGAAALGACLLLDSAYLRLSIASRERELQAMGPEVQQLLDAQREVDSLAQQRSAVAGLLQSRTASHTVWRIIASAWSKGAAVSNARLADGTFTMRGTAPVAIDVLAAVGTIEGVSEARFSAPVRNTGEGREEFSISLKLPPPAEARGG